MKKLPANLIEVMSYVTAEQIRNRRAPKPETAPQAPVEASPAPPAPATVPAVENTPSASVLHVRTPGGSNITARVGKYPVNLEKAGIFSVDQLTDPDELTELRRLQRQAAELVAMASEHSVNHITTVHKNYRKKVIDGEINEETLAEHALPLPEKIKRGKEIKETLFQGIRAIQLESLPLCAAVLRRGVAMAEKQLEGFTQGERAFATRLGIPFEPSESLVSLAHAIVAMNSRAQHLEKSSDAAAGWATPGDFLTGVLTLSPAE